MKVTRVETVRGKEPIALPEAWRAAWCEPNGKPVACLSPFSFHRVYTDEGIVGIAPSTGDLDPSMLEDLDPFYVEKFWNTYMSREREDASGRCAAGLEMALWDIVGKAAGKPLYKILGACRDRILAYAATSRLLGKEQHVRQVVDLMHEGFKAVKLRLHRPDPRDDLAVVEAVRDAVGDEMMILVDANQNNPSEGYNYWSRETARTMAEELEKLNVYFLEEPLPRADVDGLAAVADAVDIFIAGGEHTPTVYDFREHAVRGAYDILQPDVTLMGYMGITGVRKTAVLADCFGRMVIPHVSIGSCALQLASTLQAMATVEHCPMVEYPYDPPILTAETLQPMVKEPISIDEEGYLKVSDKPGIGIEIDEERLSGNVVVTSWDV